MADGGLFVHKCARDAHEQITRLSDFISPTVAAMWNFRWQVQGFIHVHPDVTQPQLVDRFAFGSGVRGNEIKRACVDVTWDDQVGRFAQILLVNTISIFEEYIERLVELNIPTGQLRDSTRKQLQFPSPSNGSKGYRRAYQTMSRLAPELNGVFSPTVSKLYSGPTIQNLLLCYRFFKEIRNVFAHNGSRANSSLMDAYAQFLPVATTAALGTKAVPKHTPPVLDQPVELDLFGVNDFSNVILRLIASYDIDLSNRAGALADISNRLNSIPPHKRGHIFSTRTRERRIQGLLQNSGLPKATLTPAFISWLKATNRIPAHW